MWEKEFFIVKEDFKKDEVVIRSGDKMDVYFFFLNEVQLLSFREKKCHLTKIQKKNLARKKKDQKVEDLCLFMWHTLDYSMYTHPLLMRKILSFSCAV